MAERYCAAVHVHRVRVGVQHPHRVERDGAERLVHLHAPHVGDLLARLVQRQLSGTGGRPREIGELVGDVALGDDRRQHFEPPLPRELLARDDERAGAVVHARSVARSRRPFSVEDRPQRRQLFERRVSARALVRRDLAHGHELVCEAPFVLRRDRALVRAERPLVLCFSRDPELPRDERRLLDHVPSVEGRRQPVVDHQVDQRAVAELVAEPRLRQRVRRVRHRLHPPRDDHGVVAGADHLVRDLDRPDARRADLVDRVRRQRDRQAGADRRLPRRSLAGPALQHLADDRVLDLVVLDLDAVERGADRDRAELGRLVTGQGTAQLAERRANGRDDHGTGHTRNLAPDAVRSAWMQSSSRTWAWFRRHERGGRTV